MVIDKTINKIVEEFKTEFQIPPYAKDEAIQAYATEAISWFKNIHRISSVDEDICLRNLVKNRMWYNYNHQVAAFQSDYRDDILTWQFSKIGSAGNEE